MGSEVFRPKKAQSSYEIRNPLRPRSIYFIGVLLLVELLPFAIPVQFMLILNLAIVYAVGAVGLNIIFGYAGLVSIAQAALMAVGGYLTAVLTARGIGFEMALVLAGAGGGVVSLVIGLIGTRVKTHYFILASLAIAELVSLVAINETGVTGGSNGIALASNGHVLGIDISSTGSFFRVAALFLALIAYFADALRASRAGLGMTALAGNEYAALASGVGARRHFAIANLAGGVLGGIAGWMLVVLDGYTGPADYGIDTATVLLLVVVVGGRGRHGSLVIAAVVLTTLSHGLLSLQAFGDLIYGAGIVLLIVLAPRGIGGLAEWLRRDLHGLVRSRSARAESRS